MNQLHIVGIGGSTRRGSSTEVVTRGILAKTAKLGCTTEMFAGPELALPPYEPGAEHAPSSARLVNAFRKADAVVIGSPGYHGSVSGLVKNALDYTEELREDDRTYFDGLPVGCIATAFGWQGAVNTLSTLRQITHALRGWPTPLGIALNTSDRSLFEAGEVANPAVLNSMMSMAEQLVCFARSREVQQTC
ncbi:MAG: NADPH-dependent oxidoreductase [Rhodococcus sp. (in: high G+C Gram-positive bacteria)]|uniref:NADPH-dependent FMN reductase n=1 Tax=Rhodococcus sp. TaxID=1831 RepID=UPI001212E9F2|nr:NAD(P)H-dependent oxidoreductase [Rhodococcus sp. (in: high G+C Gram-positive bacteria)]RZL24654.1 MAG: NADPH-dependent oxidoreductase [Rhodococcus sp. (in: high G+C Gram-positive bacteria)]